MLHRSVSVSVLLTSLVFSVCALRCPCAENSLAGPPDAKQPLSLAAQPMLYATGEGAMPNAQEEPNRARAYLEAKTYAKMQAIAEIAQLAEGTLVESSAKGRNYAAEEIIKQEVKGVVDNVQTVAVMRREVEGDCIVSVTVRAPRPDPRRVAAAARETQLVVDGPKAGDPKWLKPPKDASPGTYTSVIIDATGMGVKRSMSPHIYRPDGSEVWGTVKADYDFVNEYGVAAYATTRALACRCERAGARPLIIRAYARGSSASAGDIVISYADADVLAQANRETKILDDLRVIIVVDSESKKPLIVRSGRG